MLVYKFRSLADGAPIDNTTKILTDNFLYFAKPDTLNDPFEYSVRTTFSSVDLKTKVEYWTKAGIGTHLESGSELHQKQYIDEIEAIVQNPIELLKQNGTQGVLSTCATWENLVLWSHYADEHRGIAIEIETEGSKLLSAPTPVTYCSTSSTYDIYRVNHVIDILKMCSTKFEDWSYEKEVRFFCSTGPHKIPKENIKSVIFGLNSRKSSYDKFKAICGLIKKHLPHCKVYEVLPKRATYKIEKQEIDLTIPFL